MKKLKNWMLVNLEKQSIDGNTQSGAYNGVLPWMEGVESWC